MLRNAEFKQPDWRWCQEGQEASFPIDHITPSARGNATEPTHLTLACVSFHTCLRLIVARRKLGSFFLLDSAFIRSKSQYAND